MVAVTEEVGYSFPPPPDPEAVEWPGTPIGLTNCITRTKSRTRAYDKAIDAKPGRREELLNSALVKLVEDGGAVYHDVVVHGVRVRAYTNSEHLMDFWRDNWFSPDEWRAATGKEPPARPQVTVLALGGVRNEAEAAYYSRDSNLIVFFNTSYYGQLKSWVLGAVGRVLANEYGIHSIHGAVVEKDGKGVLYIAPTGTGKSTSSYGLMKFPNTRFHSDDWVYVRYVYHTRDGRVLSPRRIETPEGRTLRGYQTFRWLEEHPRTAAPLVGLTLDNEELTLDARDLDFDRGVEAYAYISEKVFYLRCNLVENFPDAAYEILHSKVENVPDVSPAFLHQHRDLLDEVVEKVLNADDARTRAHFRALGPEKTREVMARLFAFDNARAMLDITRVFGREQVFVNPLEPVQITDVFLLKRDFTSDLVIEKLAREPFMERLLIGETPMGTREIAYNGYRATDDDAERRWIAQLEQRAKAEGRPLYHLFTAAPDVPVTLLEEFELFRVMHRATNAWDLNTVLQKDGAVRNKMEAVARTMQVIAAAIERRPAVARYTIHDYAEFLRA